ncbi:MAG: ribosomal-protein-alanine N-acetyltransferase [Ruminococcaceae bacterium]|nr:ribosomal-protein-alanine N-acetyltransferase [Oscillospiraceae bacterium]
MIRVRKGTFSDIPYVSDLENAVFSDPWGENAISAHVESTYLSFLVAEREGAFVGYLLGSVIPPEGEILRVATLPEARRLGVGEALCRSFLSLADATYLEVRVSNTAARTLYEKLGFSLVGERKNYYKNPTEDACLYRRK